MKPKNKKKLSGNKKFLEKKIRIYIYKIIFIYYYIYFFFFQNHGLISSAPAISTFITGFLFAFHGGSMFLFSFKFKHLTFPFRINRLT